MTTDYQAGYELGLQGYPLPSGIYSPSFQDGHKAGAEDSTLEPFALGGGIFTRRPKWQRGDFASVKATQRPLFAGLNCLPGQGDLFATDGEG